MPEYKLLVMLLDIMTKITIAYWILKNIKRGLVVMGGGGKQIARDAFRHDDKDRSGFLDRRELN
jgi:hypothetical protein